MSSDRWGKIPLFAWDSYFCIGRLYSFHCLHGVPIFTAGCPLIFMWNGHQDAYIHVTTVGIGVPSYNSYVNIGTRDTYFLGMQPISTWHRNMASRAASQGPFQVCSSLVPWPHRTRLGLLWPQIHYLYYLYTLWHTHKLGVEVKWVRITLHARYGIKIATTPALTRNVLS